MIGRRKREGWWALVEETFAQGDRKKTQILKTGFHLLLFVLLRLFNTHHLRGDKAHTQTSVTLWLNNNYTRLFNLFNY